MSIHFDKLAHLWTITKMDKMIKFWCMFTWILSMAALISKIHPQNTTPLYSMYQQLWLILFNNYFVFNTGLKFYSFSYCYTLDTITNSLSTYTHFLIMTLTITSFSVWMLLYFYCRLIRWSMTLRSLKMRSSQFGHFIAGSTSLLYEHV